MHPLILGARLTARTAALAWPLAAALATAGMAAQAAGRPATQTTAQAAAQAACPGPQAAVREVFISADCADCWSAAGGATANGPPAWRFDWILPGSDAAPLAAAALRDGDDRARRRGALPPAAGQLDLPQRAAAVRLRGLSMQVQSGPAWQGYFGVQLRLKRDARSALPAGSSAWVALVELIPPGSDGSAEARALLRSVAGPLPLAALQPGQPLSDLRALRWPDGAQPTRLQARAWIEGPDGALLAVAADRCP